MRVVIAPDKFKGTLAASEVADAVAAGVRGVRPDAMIDLCPLADGGEGTVAALVASTGGRFVTRRVTGPLPEMRVEATFGISGDGTTAFVEMAAASGLALVPVPERDPAATTTFGTGELLVEAAKLGVEEIILGIGGSATIDGGIGCCHACGLPVILADGELVSATEPLCGRDLERVVLIKHGRGSPVERVRITVACDVTNPLTGLNGAASVYGPQKGATPPQVVWFDQQLAALAARTGKQKEAAAAGAGAAGGLGFAMLAYFPNATLRRGVDIVFAAVGLRRRLAGADLCLTGEGRLDAGSLHGKAPVAVGQLCRELGVRCVAIVGSAQEGIAGRAPFDDIVAVQRPGEALEVAVAQSRQRLEEIAARVVSGIGT